MLHYFVDNLLLNFCFSINFLSRINILINVLNEILVHRFLNNKILFTDIVYKLLTILNSKAIRNYLKNNKIRHINDVFKVYNFCRSLVN